MINIDCKAKAYFAIPLDGSPAAADSGKSGGVVTYKVCSAATGESKQMFGLEARHVKTAVTKEPSGGACEQSKERVEILLPRTPGCEATRLADCIRKLKLFIPGSRFKPPPQAGNQVPPRLDARSEPHRRTRCGLLVPTCWTDRQKATGPLK